MKTPPCPMSNRRRPDNPYRPKPGDYEVNRTLLQVIPQPTLTERQAIVASLAPARLRPYRQAVAGGGDGRAVELYLLDAQIASHLHATFRAAEVVIREAVHRGLAAVYTDRWFNNHNGMLDERSLGEIAKARTELARAGSRSPSPGQIVAQLMFGTWTNLFDRGGTRADGTRADYADDLWLPALSNEFTQGSPTQQQVHALTKRLNWARNRINHCESVVFGFPQPGQRTRSSQQIRRSPALLLQDTRDLVGYTDPAIQTWLTKWTDVDQLIADPLAQEAIAYTRTRPGITVQS
jgi:hypothetical protein